MRSHIQFSSTAVSAGLLCLFLLGFAGCTDKETPDGDAAENSDSTVGEVFGGDTYTYDMTIDMEQSIEAQGAEMTGLMGGKGVMTLIAGTTTEKGQRWQASTEIAMGGEMMGTKIDTVKQEQKMVYLIAPDGKVVDMEVSGVDTSLGKELTRMIENTSSRQSAMQMFMQKSWLEKSVGDSWTEESLDTINADDVGFGQGGMKGKVYLVTHTKTRYTYQGTVDTLGMKAVRVKYELLELDMAGEMNAKEVEISLSSKGSGTGMYYYSVDDRLQLAGSSDLTTSSVISMPAMSQSMPMKQHIMMSLVRRAAAH